MDWLVITVWEILILISNRTVAGLNILKGLDINEKAVINLLINDKNEVEDISGKVQGFILHDVWAGNIKDKIND